MGTQRLTKRNCTLCLEAQRLSLLGPTPQGPRRRMLSTSALGDTGKEKVTQAKEVELVPMGGGVCGPNIILRSVLGTGDSFHENLPPDTGYTSTDSMGSFNPTRGVCTGNFLGVAGLFVRRCVQRGSGRRRSRGLDRVPSIRDCPPSGAVETGRDSPSRTSRQLVYRRAFPVLRQLSLAPR